MSHPKGLITVNLSDTIAQIVMPAYLNTIRDHPPSSGIIGIRNRQTLPMIHQ